MSISSPQLQEVLRLLTIPQIGPGRLRRLVSVFGSASAALAAPYQHITRIEGFDRKIAAYIKSGGNDTLVHHQLKRMKETGIRGITIWDDRYPLLLKKTADPPVILFYKGNLPVAWPDCIGVVGMRQPDAYGRSVTESLVKGLVENGITVVSGMARGIDTVAHDAALRMGGDSYAILGCGIDYIYPPENHGLYQRITRQGAILTEYLIGTKPDSSNFPRRNRIISGVSLGTIIIQASNRSGALITANYALEQNREVFAVPGSILNPRSEGPNRLIQQGAKMVIGIDDILEELAPRLQKAQAPEKPAPPNLKAPEKALLAHLSEEPMHIDLLVQRLQTSPAVLLAQLLNLELLGVVKQLSGKMFIRI